MIFSNCRRRKPGVKDEAKESLSSGGAREGGAARRVVERRIRGGGYVR